MGLKGHGTFGPCPSDISLRSRFASSYSVGPRNSPDLSKNYYISPILTPASLLAQFPPVYLLCGERDPFSDDTLIFSGRLRDAKYARKAEVLAKQARHGEGLRMSSATQARKDPILDESEDDWVTTRFIEGWSHGWVALSGGVSGTT